MSESKSYLFKDKRFLPIFLVQFCGCLNDNILKNALIIFITYKLSNQFQGYSQILALVANSLFILPFIFFASISGQIADKYERSSIVKIIKWVEVVIVCFAAFGFVTENIFILFAAICLMGVHSTFFGPIKYSALPDHLHKNELLEANGYVEAGTFLSIFLGTVIGGFYNFSDWLIIGLSIIVSLIGVSAASFLPSSNNRNDNLKLNLNIVAETIAMVKYTHGRKQLYLSILGISWFWFIAAAIMSQIPSLTKYVLGADENVANMFSAIFTIGVGIGSFCYTKILGDEVTAKYVFPASVGISIVGIDLFFATKISQVHYEPEQLKSIIIFLSKLHNWRIAIDLFLLSFIGGLYIVPLFAIMQYFSPQAHRSRVIAVNNLINSFFMAGATIILSLLFYLDHSIPFVILLVSLFNLVVAAHIFRLIPEARVLPIQFIKILLRLIFDIMYDVEVKNIENFHKAGKRSIVIANHISYLDPALLAVYLSRKLTFAINTGMSKVFWVRPFLKIAKTLPIDTNNAMAIKTLIKEIKKNKKIAIFPEGRISLTGSLMKVYEGPGMIADKTGATILPVRIDGPQFTHFSKLKNILRKRIFPKVTITILPPIKFTAPEDMDSKMRRKYISQALYDVMVDMMFESSDYKKTLFQSLIESAKIHGFSRKIIQDNDGRVASYRILIRESFILGSIVKRYTDPGENIGLILPNTLLGVKLFFASQAYGRVPVMINFNEDAARIILSCKTAGVRVIYTDRNFVVKILLEEKIELIKSAGIAVFYIDDLEANTPKLIKFKYFITSFIPQICYNNICYDHGDVNPALIFFSEGQDVKAIVLSHRNIQANKSQMSAKVDFNASDLAFNALPMYNCFGLTSLMLMLFNGTSTFLYPLASHYKIIPEVIYDIGATIMFSADNLLNLYATHAHPYDFYSMRYIFVGGEKLKNSTRQLWSEKYGVRIFEGYWLTEAAGFIATNTPMHNSLGSVGRLMPKIEYFIEPLEGIEEKNTGRLFVRGPNIMMGFMTPNSYCIINSPRMGKLGEGWYDTGDIVTIDEDGYITIINKQNNEIEDER
jgi:acyl-[acyl-carrier-protein]-phospholipid O-acyltransferase/long-chain-fatty-acid--[acyl-carrier-protein] ligase